MERSCTQKRCINLDWLEVHAREPVGEPHNADYFRSCGLEVEEREYGTPIYHEMFVIMGKDGLPAIEIRRNPKSSGLHGIHDAEETHIRLKNRLCYFDDTAEKFENFLNFHRYERVRISRVDICLDFLTFDFGDLVPRFIHRYVKHKYAKYCGGQISMHGNDAWEGIDLNSLKWGNPKSIVSTKLYNKTLELKDKKTGLFGKPYIRQAWLCCGFIDDMQHVTKNGKEVEVWRLEYSITSSKREWAPIELDGKANKKYSLRNTLDMYKGRDRLLSIFASLTTNYFHFKKYKKGVRKDRCEDKKLFDFGGIQSVYKLTDTLSVCGEGNKKFQQFNRLITLLSEFDYSNYDENVKQATEIVISAVKDFAERADLSRPWDEHTRTMLKAAYVRKVLATVNDSVRVKQMLSDVFKVAPNIMDFLIRNYSNFNPDD